MKKHIYTDLAIENFECDGKISSDSEDISCEENSEVKVIRLFIRNKDQEKKLGKPIGEYITVYSKNISLLEDRYTDKDPELVRIISHKIKHLIEKNIKKPIDKDISILAVGIGNSSVTSDSLGPLTVSKLSVNRHIKLLSPAMFNEMQMCALSSVSPNVLGNTGIDASDTVKGIIKRTHPDCIIAIDSLAARGIESLGSTLQISDSGICPGSGTGNSRTALNHTSMGIPVIALGVPFVINSATMLYDMLSSVCSFDKMKNTEELLFGKEKLYVMQSDCNIRVSLWSEIISSAINDLCVL